MIRLRYTGLLMFASSVLSLFTGLVFSSFVARSLSSVEYGVWFFISGTFVYFQLFQKLITPWAFRDISRGYRAEKTCVVANFMLSAPSFIVYLLVAPFLAQTIGSSLLFFYISSIFIPIYFGVHSFETIIKAKFPHKMAYRDVVLDFTKIFFIWWLIGFGLLGFILSILIAQIVYLCYIFYVSKGSFRGGFSFKRLKRWLSFSWVTLYGLVGLNIYSGLSALFLGVFSSASALASYGIALTIARLLEIPTKLSSALYPKLLSKEVSRGDSIREAMALVLMFVIPMTAGCILLAPNLIEVFGSKYLDGVPALIVLAFNYFMSPMTNLAYQIISASEKVDLAERVPVKKWVRSSIFFVNSLRYLDIAVFVPLALLLIPKHGMIGCAVSTLITSFITFLMIGSRAFKSFKKIPYVRIVKFLLSSIVMSFFISLIYTKGTINTILIIFGGAITYFSCLLLMDKETRVITKKIFNEIRAWF